MQTEPNVPYYTNLAKERICFCLVKVREWRQLFSLSDAHFFLPSHPPDDVKPLNKLPLQTHCPSSHYSSVLLCNHSPFASYHFQIKSATEAIDVCSEAHQRDPRNANVLRDRAEAYILNQDYEKGDSLLNECNSTHPMFMSCHDVMSLS